jgi:hypothetical protein
VVVRGDQSHEGDDSSSSLDRLVVKRTPPNLQETLSKSVGKVPTTRQPLSRTSATAKKVIDLTFDEVQHELLKNIALPPQLASNPLVQIPSEATEAFASQ